MKPAIRLGRPAAAMLAMTCLSATLWACGPWFAESVLWHGDHPVLSAPERYFCDAMEGAMRLAQPVPGAPGGKAVLPEKAESADDVQLRVAPEDLRAALAAAGAPSARIERAAAQYRGLLEDLQTARGRFAVWRENGAKAASRPSVDCRDFPEDFPAEFREYTLGVLCQYEGKPEAAQEHWRAVLALPAAERHWRATWAAFMLGETSRGVDYTAACAAYQQVRVLAQAGAADSLGLSHASIGWEARAALDAGDYISATHLYLRTGADRQSLDSSSLRIVALKILAAPATVQAACAADPATQVVVTASVTGRLMYYETRGEEADQACDGWLHQLEALPATAQKSQPNCEQIAWAQYQRGRFSAAERWVALAPENDPWAQWLRAKLALRAGKMDAAVQFLRRARSAFPPERDWVWSTDSEHDGDSGYGSRPAERLDAELGLIQVARREYTQALDLFLRSNYWPDAASVAENILTVDELKAYADRPGTNLPAPANSDPNHALGHAHDATNVPEFLSGHEEQSRDALQRNLDDLLARRLMRNGRYQEAQRYFSAPEVRAAAADYAKVLVAGHERSRPQAERAVALWHAAQIAHSDGASLFGLEGSPDWWMVGCSYDEGDLRDEFKVDRDAMQAKWLKPTPDLLARIQASLPTPMKRWHYRFVAADLAWEAAGLMPDNTDDLARLLWTAGRWLAIQDPPAADRFYKALVNRCRKTKLGQAADQKRWFPTPEAAEKLLPPLQPAQP